MFKLLVAAIVGGLASIASTQNSTYPYTVDPSTIDPTEHAPDCISQHNVCVALCPGGTKANSCDPDTFIYSCQCSNGPTPDLTKYNGTIPFFECQQYIALCQEQNTGNVQMQRKCLKIQCGGLNAYTSTTATSTTSSSTMPSRTAMSGGEGGSRSSSSQGGGPSNSNSGGNNDAGGAASGLDLRKSCGLAFLVASGLMVFGFGLGL